MKLLIFSGLSDHKLKSKIAPIIAVDKVDTVFLVRNVPLDYHKIKSLSVPSFLRIPFIKECFKLAYAIVTLAKNDIDYIVGIYLRPHGLLAYIAGRLFRIPVIQLLIGDDVDWVMKHSRLFKRVLMRARNIGFRGTRSQERVEKLIQRESGYFIHYNVFSIPSYKKKTVSSKKEIDIINISHYEKVKRIDFFIKVISELHKAYPQIKVVLAGKDVGKSKMKYQKMAERMGLERNIQFLGYVDNVMDLMMKSKIFMMTSKAEGLPMVMIEAMSVRLPCVLPDVGNISDVAINNQNAILVNSSNVDGFIQGTKRLMEDFSLVKKISENAYATIKNLENEFSLESIKKTWEGLLV